VLEVTEDATFVQEGPDLGIQLLLSDVLQMMDGEARDHGVESPERRKRLAQIVGDDLNIRRRREPASGPFEHEWGKVDRYAGRPRPGVQHDLQKPAIPTTNVQDTPDVAGDFIDERRLAGHPMGHLVRFFEVGAGVRRSLPFVH
jgi:hypothetical protein